MAHVNDMGALIMFGFVSLIAIVGGIYFLGCPVPRS